MQIGPLFLYGERQELRNVDSHECSWKARDSQAGEPGWEPVLRGCSGPASERSGSITRGSLSNMLMGPQNLPQQLAVIRNGIECAARTAGRSVDSVTLLAVGKAQPANILRAAARE